MDYDLLNRIKMGLIRLTSDNGVEYFHVQRRRWYKKKEDYHPESGRARYRFGPNRQTVYKNRLIWMLSNGREIPDGFVVDHIDGDRTNDHPSNLGLMFAADSHRQRWEIQKAANFEQVAAFFDFIAFMGYEPDDHESIQ